MILLVCLLRQLNAGTATPEAVIPVTKRSRNAADASDCMPFDARYDQATTGRIAQLPMTNC